MVDEKGKRFAVTRVEYDVVADDITWWFQHSGDEPFDISEFEPGTETHQRLSTMEKFIRAALVGEGPE